MARAASTSGGFFFRDNLQSQGQVPAPTPYDQCPDIIGSPRPLSNAASALSSPSSWNTLYDCEPVVGASNYYYLRGMNGGDDPARDKLGLFAAPAQLILFPSTWKNNPLTTAKGAETISVSAAPGKIGVGDQPFLWKATPAPAGSTFYSFVARAVDTQGSGVIPADGWTAMSQLLTQLPAVGFRNLAYVDPAADTWTHVVAITIPAAVDTPQTLRLDVESTGFAGCTLGMVADRFTSQQELIELAPTPLVDGQLRGITFTADPGFTALLTIQCWNPGAAVPVQSSITLSVNCLLTDDGIQEALQAGTLHYEHRAAADALGPTPVQPLGMITFVAGMP
jgi:hypothetical protein